jgi:hypothetical protein
MKGLSTPALLAFAALSLCRGTAAAQAAPAQTAPAQTAAGQTTAGQSVPGPAAPAPIVHRGPITGQPNALFDRLKADFSGGKFGPYAIVSSDVPSRTVVAKRSNIDSAQWARWAYCRMGPLDMLDTLRDGSVTLTVSLQPATKWITWAAVKAEFTGTYAIGTQVKQTQCTSTGVLEEDILHRLGADIS